jgi:hypothetical protein
MRGLLVLIVLGLSATIAGAGDMLFDAIAAGDKTAVEQALTNGANVDSRARDQATPHPDILVGHWEAGLAKSRFGHIALKAHEHHPLR